MSLKKKPIIRCRIKLDSGAFYYYTGGVSKLLPLFDKDINNAYVWNDESLADKKIAYMTHNSAFKECYDYEIIYI